MSENEQIIRQCDKYHHKSHEKLESGFNNRLTNVSGGENLKSHLSRRLTFSIAICDSNDATPLHTEELATNL